jgi:hypothetical protein
MKLERMKPFLGRVVVGFAVACVACSTSFARVTGVEILSHEDVLDATEFGAGGVYERITGRVHFEVAVGNVRNRRIVDLDKAVNQVRGDVEFSADLIVIQPKDPRKNNGTLLLEIPNRGRSGMLRQLDGGDGTVQQAAGDGWFLRQGYSFASLGWQTDAVGASALMLHAPIARDHGATIRGYLRGDLMPTVAAKEIELGHLNVDVPGGSEYAVASVDDPGNVLTVRDSPTGRREVIPRARWSFAHDVDGVLLPSAHHIRYEDGFRAGRIYEYVYAVADPVVSGLGFAAVSDFASYVKHTAAAPAHADRVIGVGISQTGRFLRDFLYQGFNADENGHMALDGVLAHVAGAGRGSFNQRFAQPSRDAQPTSSLFFPTDVFPFTDLPETDPVTRRHDGLLARSAAAHVTPRIFFSNTSYEYWGRVASLTTTTPDGTRDVTLSPNVRVYQFTGLQHFSGPWPPATGDGALAGRYAQSPLPIRYFWRGMLTNMDAWLRSNVSPPASRYPRLSDGTLVNIDAYAFPHLPGVPSPPEPSGAWHLDFGTQPPRVGSPFVVLVPQVDSDGNELAGVRPPELAAPLATYVPWNFRKPEIGAAGQRVSFEGSYLPLAKDEAARLRDGDPRSSIAVRYRGRDDYLEIYARALDGLIAQRFILPVDRPALLQFAAAEWDYAVR